MDLKIKNMTMIKRILLSSLALIFIASSSAVYAGAKSRCAKEGGTWVSGNGGFCYKKLKTDKFEMVPMTAEEGKFDPSLGGWIIPDYDAGTVVLGTDSGAGFSLLGTPVNFHDGVLYSAPGTYTDGGYNFDVGVGQYAMSILWDWGVNTNIHSLVVFDMLLQGDLIQAVDSDGDGLLGHQMIGGPFPGLSMNIVASAPSAVPVPAAVWLFGSGLIGLVGFAKRKKA